MTCEFELLFFFRKTNSHCFTYSQMKCQVILNISSFFLQTFESATLIINTLYFALLKNRNKKIFENSNSVYRKFLRILLRNYTMMKNLKNPTHFIIKHTDQHIYLLNTKFLSLRYFFGNIDTFCFI